MDRVEVTDSLNSALSRIDGRTSPWDKNYEFLTKIDTVYSSFKFMDEINEFPVITVTPQEERITHISSDKRYYATLYELRAYTMISDVLEETEHLSDDIEHVLNNYRLWNSEIEEIRINSIETDGGLMAPYGVVLIKLLVLR